MRSISSSGELYPPFDWRPAAILRFGPAPRGGERSGRRSFDLRMGNRDTVVGRGVEGEEGYRGQQESDTGS